MNWEKKLCNFTIRTAVDLKAWIVVLPQFRIDFLNFINKINFKRDEVR